MQQSINAILKTIDEAINTFQDKIPGLQKQLFDELQPLLKEIEIKNGRMLNNVKNLKLLGQLKNKLQKIIINPEYKEAVSKFLDSYNIISALNMDYFKKFNQKFTPSKTLPLIKDLAFETTVNDLVGQGLKVNIVDAVADILNTNITTGGSYAALQNQLREHLLDTETGEGSLVKYTKQITTDAINQYHAQYHAAIGQDLQFNWGRYVGSLLKTSRQFCILLTKKEWVHKSELPLVIAGNIDGEKCKLSKTTGLPLGMIPGTDASNFKIRRGGYQCGHHYFEVPDNAVPKNVLNKEPVALNKNVDVEKVKSFAGKDVKLKMLDKLKGPVDVSFTYSGGSYYNPNSDEIVFDKEMGGNSTIHDEMVTYHEFGHAIHDHNEIITPTNVSPEFEKVFKDAKKVVKTGIENTMKDLRDTLRNYSDKDLLAKFNLQNKADVRESLAIAFDIIGSLTKGQYGGGHSVGYYNRNNGAFAELFAHGNYLYHSENKLIEEKIPEVVKILRNYFKQFYQD
jgi:hypothetical protein